MHITRATLTVAAMALAGIAALALPGIAHSAPDKTAEKQAHPLYDDGGTLDWRTKWADAAAIAKERRSLIFVEWGRES